MKETLIALWHQAGDVAMLLVPFVKGLFQFLMNILQFVISLLGRLIDSI